MKPYRYICLNTAEIEAVQTAYQTDHRHHVRQKCHALLLSHRGHKVPEIASLFGVQRDTVRGWFNKWSAEGVTGFAIKAGRGVKAKLDQTNEKLVDFIKKK